MARRRPQSSQPFFTGIAACSAILLLTACASVTHTETATLPPSTIHPTTDAMFTYPVEQITYQDELIGAKER